MSDDDFRRVADSLPILVWMSGTNEQGLFFNKTWLEFTGRSLGQELCKGWLEGIHADDRSVVLASRYQAFEGREPIKTEFRLRRADGEYRWVQDVGVPCFSLEQTFVGCLGSSVDITQLKLVQGKLDEERQTDRRQDEFRALLAHGLRNRLAAIASAIEVVRLQGGGNEQAGRVREIADRIVRKLAELHDDRVPEAARHLAKRVLVVDDNADSAEMIAALVSRWGHEVMQAHDGPTALALCERFSFDVVLLDIGLPEMDGYEVARRLRARQPALRPRIIAVSGYGREGDRLKSAEAGFDEHLVKPVDFAALEREIGR
jgi:PAS domain S-box-containing protein